MGITGQRSSSTTNNTTVGESGVLGNNSGNEDASNRVNTLDGGSIMSAGNVTVNQVDAGLLDTAGSIVGTAIDASSRGIDTALGLVQRVVESAFGVANRSTDVVAQTGRSAIDQVAAAAGRPTLNVFDRHGIWIILGSLGLVAMWMFRKKG